MMNKYFGNFSKRFSTALAVFLVLSFFITPLSTVFADNETSSGTGTSETSSTETTSTTKDQGTTDQKGAKISGNISLEKIPDYIKESNNTDLIVKGGSTDAENTDENDDISKDSNKQNVRMSMGPVNPWAPVAQDATPNQSEFLPEPDISTGAATYGYGIQVPPGRNGVQPNLKLEYNSQSTDQNSIFGYGWSINIPYITRVNKGGINSLFTDNYFTSSISGDLINTTGTTYSPSRETGDFTKYTYSSNTWTATDKNGTVYTFGSGASTRQDDPSNSAHIYKWMLEKVQDTSGNFILYTYYKNGGQIYPDTITYTSNGANTGIFTVTFTRQSRSDTVEDTNPGFTTTTSYRISRIESAVSGTWVHRYDLVYTTQSPSTRSLLNTITESGQESGSTTSLPAQTFTYQTTTSGAWTLATGWSYPDDEYSKSWYSQVSPGNNPQVNGHDVAISLNTAHTSDNSVSGSLVDVNGDGLLDIVQSFRCFSDGSCMPTGHIGIDGGFVYINNGTGWTYNSSWVLPADEYSKAFYAQVSPGNNPQVNGHDVRVSLNTSHTIDGSVPGELVDVNGDGLVDIVQSARCVSGSCMPNGHAGLDGVYVYLNTGTGWTYSTSWTLSSADEYSKAWYSQMSPGNNPQVNGHDVSVSLNTSRVNDGSIAGNLVDINGDGLVDIVQSYRCLNTGCISSGHAGIDGVYVYLNTGSGWAYNSSWSVPADEYSKEYYSQVSPGNNPQVNGHDVAISLNTSHVGDGSIPGLLVDVNGDGLLDIAQSNRCLASPVGSCMSTGLTGIDGAYIYLNTGTGWVYDSSWTMPSDEYSKAFSTQNSLSNPQVNGHDVRVSINTSATDDTSKAAKLVDVNNDGMADIVQSSRCISAVGGCMGSGYAGIDGIFVYLNTSTGWTYDSSFTVPADQYSKDLSTQTSTSNPQVNGHDVSVSLNTEHASDTSIAAGLSDLNGDGVVDIVQSGRCVSGSGCMPSGHAGIDGVYPYTSSIVAPLLSAITTPEGGSYALTYKPAQQYSSGGTFLNPNTPYVVQTLNQITTNDGLGNTSTTSYSYSGGKYYYDSSNLSTRRFAGFNTITKTDGAGNVTKTYFHQGDSSDSTHGEYSDDYYKIGKVYRVEQYDNSNNLYSKTINKWDEYSIATGTKFVKLVRVTNETYDGDSDHKDTTQEYTYDNATGNVTQKTDYGEVTGSDDGSYSDTGSDKATTTYSYATNGTGTYALSQATLKDQSNNKVTDTKYLYDGQTLGTLTVGNKTKERHWKSGSNWADTQWAYNTTYGIVTSMTDPRSKVTSYSYDTYNLYPATVTDPLTHATSYTYDYSSGKVKQTTDVNSLIYQIVYDGLDRVIEEKIPDLTTPTTLDTKDTFSYTDTSGSVAVHKTDYLDGSTTVDTYQYFDGLHRLLQDRNEMEASNTFSVKDLAYNTVGLLQKESLPYSSTGSSKTSATGTTSLYTNYTYDPFQRQSTVVNNLGTTSYAYDQWMVTITDANSKQKNLYKDAYDNLVKVDEKNSGSTYTTNYTWNLVKNLTNITDASSNVRNFTYDGIGRRLTAEDLHASGDASFGSWTYTYDDANNLTQSVDPKSQTINYTYDDTNRILTEDYTGGTGTEITYTYDTGTYGIGHLYNAAVSGSSSTTYTYDANGNKASESEVINSTTLATSYTYDRQGNILVITYPDSAQVRYTYNTAGLLEKIETKESGGSYGDVVSNFDYNPMEQVTTQADVNTVTTTNTYDSTKLYRLTQRVTQKGATTKHQDLSFTYDAVGNITQIVDASATNSAKTANYVYDDLYRLTSSTITLAAAGGNYTHTTTYDALGNISTKSDIGTYLYQGNSGTNYANPHAATSINGITYTYDNNGNATGNGTFSNTWDYKNQLSQTTVGATTINYYYDDQGNRARYNVGSTNYYTPNRYYQKKGNTLNKYVFAGDNLVANIETKTSGVTPRYVHLDQLNSTAIVTSASGNQVQLIDYYPFGQVRQNNLAGSFDSRKKYATHELDDDTGFDYVKARYYLGDRGRFISQDPSFWTIGSDKIQLMDPQTQNSYSYAGNNPIKNSDPTGKCFWDGCITEATILAGGLAMYAPQITNFLQGLTTPLGQVGLSQAVEDAHKGNYGWAIFGVLASGELPEGKIAPVFDGLWTAGKKEAPALNAISHAAEHGLEFGIQNTKDYVQSARDFITKAINEGLPTKAETRNGFDIFRTYDKNSNTFASFEVNQSTNAVTPRTMYKPTDGAGYFSSQRGSPVDIKSFFKN